MRACIYGAGAMGTVLGAFIARAGLQIDLITRNREHVEALNARGAHIGFPATGGGFTQSVTALLPQDMQGEYDIIFLMTKQRYNGEVVAFLKPFLAPDGVVCTLQNGLPEKSVAAVAGGRNTLGCAVSWGATYLAPGQVNMTSSPQNMTFALGSPFGVNPKANAVARYLSCAGSVEVEADFAGARWSKLIINSAFSSLSAITGLTFGYLSRDKSCRAVVQAMLKEGIDVALANGVRPAKIQGHDMVRLLNYRGRIKKAVSFMLIPIAMKKHAALISGMYYDLKAGKKCDIDFVSGVVEEYASARDIAVPFTSAVLDIAARIEGGEMKPEQSNMRLLTALLK